MTQIPASPCGSPHPPTPCHTTQSYLCAQLLHPVVVGGLALHADLQHRMGARGLEVGVGGLSLAALVAVLQQALRHGPNKQRSRMQRQHMQHLRMQCSKAPNEPCNLAHTCRAAKHAGVMCRKRKCCGCKSAKGVAQQARAPCTLQARFAMTCSQQPTHQDVVWRGHGNVLEAGDLHAQLRVLA